MKLTLFTANSLGGVLLSELASRNFYPDVVTYVRGFQRTSLAKDLGVFRRDFKMTFISESSYDSCGSLPPLGEDNIPVCVDWTKDFFKGADFPVIYAHPSLLPAYRGYSAVSEQFVRGVAVSGASFYQQGAKIDGGDILYKKEIRIGYGDYPSDFLEKYASVCADFIIELDRKGFHSFEKTPQDEEQAFYLQRKRGRDALIDFNRDAYSLYNTIRGYSRPFFGAYFIRNGKKYTVWRSATEKWQGEYGKSGQVLAVNDYGAEISCGSGSIIFTEVELDGRIFHGEEIPFAPGDMLAG